MKVIILILLLSLSFSKEIDTDIRMVHVIFRHGMRYPNSSELYPKDPYRHYFSDKHYFDLTEEGKKGSYALGSFLRKRYGELIGDKYNNKIVHTSSTLTNRTIMTAQLVLAGLFQDPLKKMLSEYFDWDSLSYQIKKGPLNIDPYQHPPQCMAYTSEYLRLLNSSDYDIIMKKYANFFKYVNTNAGITIKDFKDVNNIYQMLLIEHTMNFTLPEWAQKIYPDKIEEVASQLLTVSNYNPTLRRLNGGKPLSIIIKNLLSYVNKSKPEEQQKMYLMSGHDLTVASVLAALEVFKPHVPKYNAAVLIELHQEHSTEQYLIKMYYVKGVDLSLEQLYIKGCPYMCTLEDFIEAVKSNLVDDYEVECEQPRYD